MDAQHPTVIYDDVELWGGCPHCHRNDGMINVGKSQWVVCKAHKVMWRIGTNLFSGWRDQTYEEQLRIYDELGCEDFEEITRPWFLGPEDRLRKAAQLLRDTADQLDWHRCMHDRARVLRDIAHQVEWRRFMGSSAAAGPNP